MHSSTTEPQAAPKSILKTKDGTRTFGVAKPVRMQQGHTFLPSEGFFLMYNLPKYSDEVPATGLFKSDCKFYSQIHCRKIYSEKISKLNLTLNFHSEIHSRTFSIEKMAQNVSL